MRYATIELTAIDPEDTFANQRHVRVDGEIVATYEALHYNNLLDDGTAVALSRFTGDADRLTAAEAETVEVLACTVSSGQQGLAYVHYDPSDLDKSLLEMVDSHEISIDWPVAYTERGFRLTLFGADAALRRAIAAIPKGVRVTLERTGDYQPSTRHPAWQLTERQREIVRAALAAGYYDTPRRVTQRDLAVELGLSQGTVSEHLQRAEAKLVRSIME